MEKQPCILQFEHPDLYDKLSGSGILHRKPIQFHHDTILEGLCSLKLDELESRGDAA